jgi:hypothetical protein
MSSMVKLTEPSNVGELAVIKSLLDVNDISYVVRHEHVSSLYPGVPFLACWVMVDERDFSRGTELLSRLRLPIREAS